MIDTLALVKEASYAFLPQLLARGNFRQPKSSGYFPVHIGEGAVQTTFTMIGMQEPYGYDPIIRAIKSDGSNDIVKNDVSIDFDGDMTIFVDLTFLSQSYDYVFWFTGDGSRVIAFRCYGSSDVAFVEIDENNTENKKYLPFTYTDRNDVAMIRSDGKWYFDIGGERRFLFNSTLTGSLKTLAIFEGAFITQRLPSNLYTLALYNRGLSTDETAELTEQSLLGFPGIRADAYGDNLEYAQLRRTRRRSFGSVAAAPAAAGSPFC